jgi:hypothetical protein
MCVAVSANGMNAEKPAEVIDFRERMSFGQRHSSTRQLPDITLSRFSLRIMKDHYNVEDSLE